MVTQLTQEQAASIIKFINESNDYAAKRSLEDIGVAYGYLSAAMDSVIKSLEGDPKFRFIKYY